MDMLAASWRDAVMLVVALIGVYLVLTVMRLFQVGRSRPAAAEPPSRERDGLPQSRHPLAEPTLADGDDEPLPPPKLDDVVEAPARLSALLGRQREPTFAPMAHAAETAPAARGDFSAELARSSLEIEVQQLRRESTGLRQQLAGIQQELAQMKASRNISPLYSEAVSLAQRGVTADGIASQCGISLGEAELVAALARADTDQRATGEDGNDGNPGPGRRTGTHG